MELISSKASEKLSSSALVVHKTENFIISCRCLGKDDKEMHQNEKRTCSACVFSQQICRFVAVSFPSSLSLLKVPIVANDGFECDDQLIFHGIIGIA